MEKTYSVLFVDDEESILRALERGLIDEDYNCFFAESGMKALTIMDTQEIHVIVSDMRMPVMNGLQLLKEVEQKHPDAVKVILSGYTQLQQILTTINQVDIFKFITKPWNLEDEFKGVIRKSIEYYKLREENTKIKKDLQLKNKSYLNILQNIDDKVSIANMKSDMLSSFTLETLGFNCRLEMNPDLDIPYVFEFQRRSYEKLSKGLRCEKKEFKPEIFIKSLLTQIQSTENVEILNFSNKITFTHNILVLDKVAKSILSCAIESFRDDMESSGIYAAAWSEGNSKLCVSIFSPIALTFPEKGVSSGLMNLHLKQSFLNSALAVSAAAARMSFKSVRRENYMVFQLEIPYSIQIEDSSP
ncbi:Response regulator receiver domain-containing protein [Peptoclostridium litorale DSM 5388]|uniref:Stage 0 sporulation protein A homolog n=1 Tax=Peptoclostridium litorale DSM 5388 TaxID=1121324 RepID=A0A069RBZ7_PEPLI|nr:response regulator [Peptoclostridium litorale]KDR94561.1 response regulator receiver protein [Peptoclostridium litorale DSM 5388]SIO31412.1 Response regulator receiver domain-containing protein [Peptoclostridium litorale DSM 5388]